MKRASPVYVSILRIENPRDVTPLFDQQYELQANNLLVVPVMVSPGTYMLAYGIDVRDELPDGGPLFYKKECILGVSDGAFL